LYAVGKVRPARRGEEVRPAGMVAWLREESAGETARSGSEEAAAAKGRSQGERTGAGVDPPAAGEGTGDRAIAAKQGLSYMAVREVVAVEGRGHH